MTDNNNKYSKDKKQKSDTEVIRLQQEICSLQAELQDLRLIAEKFSKAFYNNQTAAAIVRLEDATFVEVNDACLESLGYTREEMIGKSAWELNIWTDFAEREEIMNQYSKAGYVRNFECQFGKKKGGILIALMSSSIIDINGVKHILTSACDITERKKAEEALKESEMQFFGQNSS
jgi:PAS domain S-box-containing protein